MVSTASSTVSAVESSIQLDSDDSALVRLQVSTDANDISLIENLPFLWTLGNATNGVSSSNGISNVQANGFLEKNVDYPGGGEIVFDYDSANAPFWMFMSPSSITIDLLPFPEENTNGGETNTGNNATEPSPDPDLIALILDCGDIEWSIPDNSTKWAGNPAKNIRECSIYNSNQVTVFVEMDLDLSVQGVEIDGDLGSSFSLFSNETRSLTLTVRDSGSFRDGTIELTFEINAPDFIQNSSSISLNFSFTADEIQVDNSDSNGEESSSDNSMMIVAAISVGVLLALIAGVVILRRSTDDEDDEDDMDEKLGSIPLAVSGDANQTGFDSDIPKGVPLDELMRQGKKPAPVSMKGRRKSKENEEEEPEIEEEEPEIEEEEPEIEEEDDYTKSDDYHVDEDGTEWWKDEVGVWWWRGPDDEEWSEYVD